jgi:hypothetical protein
MDRDELLGACFALFLATWGVGIVFNSVEERGFWNVVSDLNLALSVVATGGLILLLAIRLINRRKVPRSQ